MKRKSPQQKKRLSYLKDSRNTYGENSKSSRKSIRHHKRHVVRANRRQHEQATSQVTGAPDLDALEAAEIDALGHREKRWAKFADEPLGEVVQHKLRRRQKLGIDQPQDVIKKIRRIRQRTKR